MPNQNSIRQCVLLPGRAHLITMSMWGRRETLVLRWSWLTSCPAPTWASFRGEACVSLRAEAAGLSLLSCGAATEWPQIANGHSTPGVVVLTLTSLREQTGSYSLCDSALAWPHLSITYRQVVRENRSSPSAVKLPYNHGAAERVCGNGC